VFEFRVPSKCFVFGEYVAMTGGPALLYSGFPEFVCRIEAQVFLKDSGDEKALAESPFSLSSVGEDGLGQATSENFLAPQSPAGRWLAQNGVSLRYWQVETPYPLGGLGRSSAEFLAAWLFVKHNRFIPLQERASHFDWPLEPQKAWAVWADFRSLYENNEPLNFSEVAENSRKKPAPSGYDVLAQSQRGWVLVEASSKKLEVFTEWPFPELWIGFFPVGVKQATHEHLEQLPWVDEEGEIKTPPRMSKICEQLAQAFFNRQPDEFIEGIREFRHELQVWGLEAPNTTAWIEKIQNLPGFVCAKGCGAMGADFVMVVVEKASLEGFLKDFNKAAREDGHFVNPDAGPLIVR
jgi:hypothetical protein